jgi:hypothetical protein
VDALVVGIRPALIEHEAVGDLVDHLAGRQQLGPCPAVGRTADGQPDAVLVVEGYHPVIEDLGCGDRGLAVIELGEGHLGVGVDDRLLICVSPNLI